MTAETIGKIYFPQTIIRAPYVFHAGRSNDFLKLIRSESKPVFYFRDRGPESHVEWIVRAFLTGDIIPKGSMYLDTLRIWGLTLHFFRVE